MKYIIVRSSETLDEYFDGSIFVPELSKAKVFGLNEARYLQGFYQTQSPELDVTKVFVNTTVSIAA